MAYLRKLQNLRRDQRQLIAYIQELELSHQLNGTFGHHHQELLSLKKKEKEIVDKKIIELLEYKDKEEERERVAKKKKLSQSPTVLLHSHTVPLFSNTDPISKEDLVGDLLGFSNTTTTPTTTKSGERGIEEREEISRFDS